MRFALVFVLLLSLVGLYAWGDTPVTCNQGAPGKQGCWPVSICGPVVVNGSDGGPITVNGTVIVIGPDGGSVPVNITQSIPIQVFTDGGFLGTVNVLFDGGFMGTTAPVRCATITNTNTSVGVVSTAVPAAAQAGRIYITVCNSAQNAGVDLVKCRADGVAPVAAAGNAGDFLEEGDCIQYPVNAAQTILCIANSAATNVLSFECTP